MINLDKAECEVIINALEHYKRYLGRKYSTCMNHAKKHFAEPFTSMASEYSKKYNQTEDVIQHVCSRSKLPRISMPYYL